MAVVLGDLKTEGAKLKPPVSSATFAKAASSESFQLVADTDDLQYKNAHVDAYFDGKTILVRCDRLEKNQPDAQARLIAHEVFRKMSLEGDEYEESRQLSLFRNSFDDSACGSPAPAGACPKGR